MHNDDVLFEHYDNRCMVLQQGRSEPSAAAAMAISGNTEDEVEGKYSLTPQVIIMIPLDETQSVRVKSLFTLEMNFHHLSCFLY